MTVYLCEDSIDGIFTAIYDAYHYINEYHEEIRLLVASDNGFFEQEFFCEYKVISTDMIKAVKVAKAIKKKISEKAYMEVSYAAASDAMDKADVIFNFLRLGFRVGRSVTDNLSDKYVMRLFELSRAVGNELHLYKGFLRFTEISDEESNLLTSERHVLLGKFEPANNIVALITPHFVKRLHEENFIIFDLKRGIAALHEVGHQWIMAELSNELIGKYEKYTENEREYQKLWLTFFKSIGIEDRKNEKLQKSMLRLHYRKHMTEFIQN